MDITERILAACRELARYQGFYNMNMDQLAARAGISKRTLYRYFRSKEAVVEAAMDQFMAEIFAVASQFREQESNLALLFEYMTRELFTRGQFVLNNQTLDDLRKHYPHIWQKVDAFRMEQINKTITTLIDSSSNSLVKDMNPLILSTMVQASIRAILNPDFILENNLSFEECARQMNQLFLAAFSVNTPL